MIVMYTYSKYQWPKQDKNKRALLINPFTKSNIFKVNIIRVLERYYYIGFYFRSKYYT